MNTNPKNCARFTFLVEKVSRHIIKAYRCFVRVPLIPKNMLNNHIMCRWRLDRTGEASKIHFWKIFACLSYHPFGIWGFRYHLHFVKGNLTSRCQHKKTFKDHVYSGKIRFTHYKIIPLHSMSFLNPKEYVRYTYRNMWLWRLDHSGDWRVV